MAEETKPQDQPKGGDNGGDEVAKLKDQVSNLNAAIKERSAKIQELSEYRQQSEQAVLAANSIIQQVEAIKADPSIKNIAWLMNKPEEEIRRKFGTEAPLDSDESIDTENIPPKLLKQMEEKYSTLEKQLMNVTNALVERDKHDQERERKAETAKFQNELNTIRKDHFTDLSDKDWQKLYASVVFEISQHGPEKGMKNFREWVDDFRKDSHTHVVNKERKIAEEQALLAAQGGLPDMEIPEGGFTNYKDAVAHFNKITQSLKGV
uniref:Uncharacterized protein n=1 Tax=viral metagenome TaxID=1070528 RepID=A0A6H1ZIM6_9ZZZZ